METLRPNSSLKTSLRAYRESPIWSLSVFGDVAHSRCWSVKVCLLYQAPLPHLISLAAWSPSVRATLNTLWMRPGVVFRILAASSMLILRFLPIMSPLSNGLWWCLLNLRRVLSMFYGAHPKTSKMSSSIGPSVCTVIVRTMIMLYSNNKIIE